MEKLKLGQIIYIDNKKYSIINMIEFEESGWKWQEYEVVSSDNKHSWLSIELSDDNTIEYWLYDIYVGPPIQTDAMDFSVNGINYKMYEKGEAKVFNYFGNADVDILEKCNFIDYISEDKKSIISIEKWEGEVEKSIGKKIENSYIKISEEIDEKVKSIQGKSNPIANFFSCTFWILIAFFIIFAIVNGSGNKKMQKYLDKETGKYEYVTSVTNNINNTKSKVYKCTQYTTVNETVRDIINGTPEGIVDIKTLNDDGSTKSSLSTASISTSSTYSNEAEENGVGITTKNEYAYVYKEGGIVYIQISKFKYLDGGTTYHSSRSHYYTRIYRSGVKSNGYTSYSSSARQESINSRKSSGGGTSSGK